jgi:hypothetical protein
MKVERIFKMMAAIMLLAVTAASCSKEVKKVELSQTTLTLVAGDSAVLTATVLPDRAIDKTVMWASDNPAVATVGLTDGIVKAVSEGTATIIVTTLNEKTAECKVTVKKGMAKVRFQTERDIDYGIIIRILLFGSREDILEYGFKESGSTSDYFAIPAGYHIPVYERFSEEECICGINASGRCNSYNFQVSRKYTILNNRVNNYSIIED